MQHVAEQAHQLKGLLVTFPHISLPSGAGYMAYANGNRLIIMTKPDQLETSLQLLGVLLIFPWIDPSDAGLCNGDGNGNGYGNGYGYGDGYGDGDGNGNGNGYGYGYGPILPHVQT